MGARLSDEMTEEMAEGAAIMFCFIQDVFTNFANKERRPLKAETFVLMLDLIGKSELPDGLVDSIRSLADDLNPE